MLSLIHLVAVNCRPRSEPSLERMKVGLAPLTLTRPVDQVAPREPHHRTHADIVLSPTPPPKAPTAAQPPWQAPARSPQPVAVAPAPAPAQTAVSPVVVAVDARARPAGPPKESGLLAYIRDEEK